MVARRKLIYEIELSDCASFLSIVLYKLNESIRGKNEKYGATNFFVPFADMTA